MTLLKLRRRPAPRHGVRPITPPQRAVVWLAFNDGSDFFVPATATAPIARIADELVSVARRSSTSRSVPMQRR